MTLEGFDKRRREHKYLGWVYVAQNSCFADKVFKIGQTQTSPSERMDTLSASTSVYKKFDLVYFVHVSEHLAAEKYVHQTLKDFRLNPGKEFFNAPLMTIVKTVDEAGDLFQIPLGRTQRLVCFHQLWKNRSFPVQDVKRKAEFHYSELI